MLYDYSAIEVYYTCTVDVYILICTYYYIITRQVTRAMHVRNRVCPRVELILKIIIILLIANNKSEKDIVPCMGFELGSLHSATVDVIINRPTP